MAEISCIKVKELREETGAGIMDCKRALQEAEGDTGKATEILKTPGPCQRRKEVERTAGQGVVDSYIHAGGRIGAMVEVNCETDFVARTDDFTPVRARSGHAGCRHQPECSWKRAGAADR